MGAQFFVFHLIKIVYFILHSMERLTNFHASMSQTRRMKIHVRFNSYIRAVLNPYFAKSISDPKIIDPDTIIWVYPFFSNIGLLTKHAG